VILTKTFNPDAKAEDLGPAGLVNHRGSSRKVRPVILSGMKLIVQRIFASVQDSLKRLQLEYIDVLQLHRFDPETPIEETMQALHDVVQKGWVRYVGMSSCWAWQFQLMQSTFIHSHTIWLMSSVCYSKPLNSVHLDAESA
jgi:aryl-alcohol dehydrogenase-like predicted oxidoreductase